MMRYLAALLLTVGAFAGDFDYVEIKPAMHNSGGGFPEINSGIDRACLGARAPLFWVLTAQADLCLGYERADGVVTQAGEISAAGWYFRAERFGGPDLETVTGYSVGYEYEPGWKPFGVQPILSAGYMWSEDTIESDTARCVSFATKSIGAPVGNAESGEICQQRALVSDRQMFQLALGFRF